MSRQADPDEAMPVLRAIGRAVVRAMPRNELLFRIARKIVDRHNGDNDFDYRTNGELWFAKTVLPRARVVFDVGANRGDWTLLAHELNRDACIHSFEPSGPTFAILEQRASLPNVILNPFGLGQREEEVTMWVFAEGALSNSLYQRVGTMSEQQSTETVRIATLDGYCRQHGIDSIDLLKIDVEGHEISVLKGGERMFRESRVSCVQFEYNDTFIDSRTQLKDVFAFFGQTAPDYDLYKLFPHELRHVPEYRQQHETYRYSNWVALRRDVDWLR
jgi:FkbM family methyltransferase